MNTLNEYQDDHARVIIHLDLDCFYAQVETNKNPSLIDKPLGIQQKHIIVTCNYLARDRGVLKCMLLSEAKLLCPNMVIVNGEDLHDYRQVSYNVTNFLRRYTENVERLGLDENFIDVSDIVASRIRGGADFTLLKGNVAGDTSEKCQCGCEPRLIIGTQIAQEIRDNLLTELNLTSCAGVAHNKLLAKIVGAVHKPNQQSVVFPNSATELLLSLKSVSKIPGIGVTIAEQLKEVGILTVHDLQYASDQLVQSAVGEYKCKAIKDLSFGIDNTPIKNSGRPLSIGLEDSCAINHITVIEEVKNKLSQLLTRLLILVDEDGRIPYTIKLTVRKLDRKNKMSHRETRQCNISPSLFNSTNPTQMKPQNFDRILQTLMTLFTKLVDTSKPYHITLLGLSFTKFNEKSKEKNSLMSFLKQNFEVQSITNIENPDDSLSSGRDSDSSKSSLNSGISKLNLEPPLKKVKIGEFPTSLNYPKNVVSDGSSEDSIKCPPNVDETVFRELPCDLQRELWQDYRARTSVSSLPKKMKTNTLFNYFHKQ